MPSAPLGLCALVRDGKVLFNGVHLAGVTCGRGVQGTFLSKQQCAPVCSSVVSRALFLPATSRKPSLLGSTTGRAVIALARDAVGVHVDAKCLYRAAALGSQACCRPQHWNAPPSARRSLHGRLVFEAVRRARRILCSGLQDCARLQTSPRLQWLAMRSTTTPGAALSVCRRTCRGSDDARAWFICTTMCSWYSNLLNNDENNDENNARCGNTTCHTTL